MCHLKLLSMDCQMSFSPSSIHFLSLSFGTFDISIKLRRRYPGGNRFGDNWGMFVKYVYQRAIVLFNKSFLNR